MRKLQNVGKLIFLLLLTLLPHPGVALEPEEAPEIGASAVIPATAPWFVKRVDPPVFSTTDDLGRHASIAIGEQGTGMTWVSYYDANEKDLWATFFFGDGQGNCGPADGWYCSPVDSDGDVGQYSAIAINPINGWPAIAYYDATNRALKYAFYECDIICDWSDVSVHSYALETTLTGLYPSLKFGSDGVPRIAYYISREAAATDSLNYAYEVGSGGNCGPASDWQCNSVAAGESMGLYPALDLDADDQPHIAYYDGFGGDLYYAQLAEQPGLGGCFNDDWDCPVIESTDDVGRFPDLHVARVVSETTRIVYYDATNGEIKYAVPSSSGNCGGGEWRCDTLTTVVAGLTQMGLALTVDGAGYPLIAYQQTSESVTSTVNTARPVTALGILDGNCGPEFGLRQTWQCDTIAAGFSPYEAEGRYLDVAVNSSGLATIAYYETDSYYGTGTLKVAQQRLPIFLPLALRSF